MGAFAEFQKAVYRALSGSPTLAALVSTRIYDDVPHGKEDATPTFPFVTIGEQSGTEAGAHDTDAAEMSITIHCWSRSAGRVECLNVLDAIRAALHNRSHVVAQGLIVRLDYQDHETLKDPDGETYHGVIRFEGFYHISNAED